MDRVFDFPESGVTTAAGLVDMSIIGGSIDDYDGIRGGGVRVRPGRMVELNNVVIRNNVARTFDQFGWGGGLTNEGGQVRISHSAIISNSSDFIGGISNIDGSMHISNSTISSNQVSGFYAFSHLDNSSGDTIIPGDVGTMTLSDVTIGYNLGGTASLAVGSIGGDTTTIFHNTILNNNTVSQQCILLNDGGTTTLTSTGYNLAGDGTCNLTAGTDLPNTIALLTPLILAENTYYHPLGNTSPALDSGDSEFGDDQRHLARPYDLPGIPNTTDGTDRGAIEMGSTTPTAVVLSHLSVMGEDGFTRGALGVLALAALGIIIAVRRR